MHFHPMFSAFIIWTCLLSGQLTLLAQPRLPQPPTTGTPKGNNTPGTTRLPSTCPTVDQPLTALVANRGNDFTTNAYPTLWVYVPYTDRERHDLEFSLFDGRERQLIYRTAIELPDRPGLIKIKLPQSAVALVPGQTYRWYLNFNCDRIATKNFDLFVSGWIKRVEAAESTIWYDAIDDLATRHFSDLNSPKFNIAWREMLTRLGAEKLITAPFIDRPVSTTSTRFTK